VSNSFFWRETNLEGLLDLVGRSWKPLQETSWASIGNVLTSIQTRVATENGVLVPWNSWRHEKFKSMSTLHEADRGGFIFSPEVGFHEQVHELDFSSLYPNIMTTRNISPDKIRCECHSERDDVPDLGYSICDEDGFIVEVLEPIISDREEYKAAIAEAESEERIEKLQGRSSALKWILVSCFGYQGFSNAKFGRIECHEAINAYAREILLDIKEILEDHGWRVVHGIVDSVWVQAIPDADQTPLDTVADVVTEAVGITLEYEAEYDWIAFVPRKDSQEGALNRYFGKVAATDEFKKRGIELRQRSTPAFIERCQTEWLETLDRHREPEAVCDQLKVQLSELRAGNVAPEELLIRRRVSKERDEYSQYTRNVAALERAATHEFDVAPGEDIEYVVVDDDKRSAARVQLEFESLDRYDKAFYSDLLIRAAESVLSPLGWNRGRIRQYLADTETTAITAY
jgi:DNA polymerase I